MAAVNWTLQDIDEDYDMVEFTNRTGHQLDEMIIEVKSSIPWATELNVFAYVAQY